MELTLGDKETQFNGLPSIYQFKNRSVLMIINKLVNASGDGDNIMEMFEFAYEITVVTPFLV